MNLTARSIIPMLALLAAAVWTNPPAMAADEPPVVRALLDSTGMNAAARPTYDSIDVAADGTITLSDMTMTFESDSDSGAVMSYEVGSLVLSRVTEIAAGLFEVAEADWSNVTVTAEGESVAAIPLITTGSLYIQQPAKDPTAIERIRAANMLAEEFEMPEALILVDGQSVTVEDLSGTWQGDPASGAGTTQFSVRRIHFPGAVFDDGGNPLAMAGYDELELAVSGTSSTVYTDDAVGFDLDLRIDGHDMGSLIVELGADGIPLALFTAVDASEPDPDALMPFTEDVSIKHARLRFEDASLTGRVLSLLAESEGTDVDSFVADATQGLDMMLAEVLEPDLARQVSAALTTYLNDPRSITFALSPAQPVQFAELMAGLQDPAALVELLQLSITAND